MELSNINVYENMVVNIHTIHKLMEYKKGGDALLLWFRYYEQRNMQGQLNTFSTDEFMMKGMGWGKDRFTTAKKILKECGMIDIINVRDDETHQSIGWFVKVNYTFNPQSVRTHNIIMEVSKSSLDLQNPQNPYSGKQGSKIQYNYNINNTENFIIPDNDSLNSSTEQGKTIIPQLDIIKNSDDIRDLFNEDEISQYKWQLKILLKMIELGYKVKKSKSEVIKQFNWLKAKANLYNVKQPDGNIAWQTFYQKIDKWFDWHTENGKKVKNFKTSIIPFISK